MTLLGNKYVIIGILVTAIAGGASLYLSSLKREITNLTTANTELTLKLNISEESVKNLRNALDDQNQAVQQMKDDADAREKEGAAALAKVKTETEIGKKRAISIMAAKIPKGQTACAAANDLINAEINNEK